MLAGALARYQGVVWQSEQLTLEKVATAALAPEAPPPPSPLCTHLELALRTGTNSVWN